MRSEEREQIDNAAFKLVETYEVLLSEREALRAAEARVHKVEGEVKKAKEALLKLVTVGRNTPKKALTVRNDVVILVTNQKREATSADGSITVSDPRTDYAQVEIVDLGGSHVL